MDFNNRNMMDAMNSINPQDPQGIRAENPGFNPNIANVQNYMGMNMPGSVVNPYIGMNNGIQNIEPYSAVQAAADPPAATDPGSPTMNEDMQQFMEQGYLMGPNCFGRDSQRYANQLMEFINDEFRDSLYYTILSRRSPTARARRIFRNISADELKHSRRFAAAYFLITGKRYFPTRNTVEPVIVPSAYNQALRERYLAESRDAVKYRQFAQNTTDRCLKRMALNTSDDERQHAQEILDIIQSM